MILNSIAAVVAWFVLADEIHRFMKNYKQLAHVTFRVYDSNYKKQRIGLVLIGVALLSALTTIRISEVSSWLTYIGLCGGYAAFVFHYLRPYGMDEHLLVYQQHLYELHTLNIITAESNGDSYMQVNLEELNNLENPKPKKPYKFKLLIHMDAYRQFEHLLKNSQNRVIS